MVVTALIMVDFAGPKETAGPHVSFADAIPAKARRIPFETISLGPNERMRRASNGLFVVTAAVNGKEIAYIYQGCHSVLVRGVYYGMNKTKSLI